MVYLGCMPAAPRCSHCGQSMKPARNRVGGGFLVSVLQLFLIVAGLVLAVVAFPCGTVLGIPMVLIALVMGGSRVRVWRCRRCRVVVPRG